MIFVMYCKFMSAFSCPVTWSVNFMNCNFMSGIFSQPRWSLTLADNFARGRRAGALIEAHVYLYFVGCSTSYRLQFSAHF